MNTFVRMTGALLFAGGLLVTGVATASAAPLPVSPNATADVECLSSVSLPASGFNVTLPASKAGSSNCFLVRNDSGEGVMALQFALKTCNNQGNLAVDGDFGPGTMAALEAVQSAHHISADGMYGNQSRGVIQWPSESLPKRCSSPNHF
jgi:peptidoglycan hydrolase-like protein with peptidoglycan-binding domain